jgi:hypothetical protein
MVTGIDEGIAFTSGNAKGILAFYTTSGYSLGKINKNHSENSANGYMQDRNDFRNVEVTFYVKVVEALSNDCIRLKCRTGKQIGVQNCEGCGIGFELYYDGTCRPFKERRMGDSLTYGMLEDSVGDIEGKWIGVKMCFFNTFFDQNVKYELYLDTELSNNWRKYCQLVDDGTGMLAGGGMLCDGLMSQPITWGGPIIFLSWGNISDPNGIIFKNISIREIDVNLPTIEPIVPMLFDVISVPTAPPSDDSMWNFPEKLIDTWSDPPL